MSLAVDRIQALLQERRCAVARGSLLEYCRMMWPDELPAQHHRLIIQAVQDAVDGTGCPRVIIMAPPGSAKSRYASVRFPSWFRGKYPELPVITASFGQELANDFSREVRNTCMSEQWFDIWGVRVSGDSTAVDRWATVDGGKYQVFGVGANVPGRRASLVVLDDISGGMDDAVNSTVTRKRVWQWWLGDLLPRLKPESAVVVIGTRYHSEDFIGKLLQENENATHEWQKWRVINIQMEAGVDDELGRQPGERLWGEYFTQEMVERARMDNDIWMSQYQQKPIVESGQYFKREWIQEYDLKVDVDKDGVATVRGMNLVIYGASDYAVTHGGGDYTVHIVAGVDEADRMYIVDCWRGQTDPNVWIDELTRLAKRWKPLEWFEEKGQIARGLGSTITKSMDERKCFVYRSQHAMPRGNDGFNSKQVGAQGIRGRMSQSMVFFPRGAWWMADMLSEMMAFPTEKSGVHDDTVDALALLGRALDKMTRPAKPREKKKTAWWQPMSGLVTIGDMIKYSDSQTVEGPKRI